VSRGAALVGALLATFAAPPTWALSLAAFLARGGIVLVALPIVVVPTPVGVGNVVGPSLISVAFGNITSQVAFAAGVIAAGLLAWIVIGGCLAALLEAESARIVARDVDVVALSSPGVRAAGDRSNEPGRGRGRRVEAGRILVARSIAYLPLVAALAWGATRLVMVAYRELTNPLDVAVPIVVRVLGGAPDAVAAIVLTWVAGEIVGALAARRIVLIGDGVVAALRAAIGSVLHEPLATIARWAVPSAVLVVVLAPSMVTAGLTWTAVRSAAATTDAIALFGTVLVFVALWLVGLLLIAVACAWRAAVWTVVVARGRGTFGGSPNRRPGGWRTGRRSATL
jgi:hypothetical protein